MPSFSSSDDDDAYFKAFSTFFALCGVNRQIQIRRDETKRDNDINQSKRTKNIHRLVGRPQREEERGGRGEAGEGD